MKRSKYPAEVLYKRHHKLIHYFAWKNAARLNIEVEELVAELNLVFCICCKKYDHKKGKFSAFLSNCIVRHILNMIKANNCKKNANKLYLEIDVSEICKQQFTVEDQFIIFEQFVKNSNPVIRSIAGIISTYKLPELDFRNWLKRQLISFGFTHIEIQDSFKQLKTLY